MSITITFTADSAERLREQMLFILNGGDAVREVKSGFIGQNGPLPGRTGPFGDKPEPEPINRDIGPVVTGVAPKKTKVAKKAPPVQEPVEEEEDISDEAFLKRAGVEEPTTLEKMNQSYEPDADPEVETMDAVEAEKLKKKVIDQLAELFAAGKVKVVRHVIDKYGQGAKSFPEIDASQFPAIRDAIARGETA